jgi:hypothetical protein
MKVTLKQLLDRAEKSTGLKRRLREILDKEEAEAKVRDEAKQRRAALVRERERLLEERDGHIEQLHHDAVLARDEMRRVASEAKAVWAEKHSQYYRAQQRNAHRLKLVEDTLRRGVVPDKHTEVNDIIAENLRVRTRQKEIEAVQ